MEDAPTAVPTHKKRQGLGVGGDGSDPMKKGEELDMELTTQEKNCVLNLRELQNEHDVIEADYNREWNILKARYLEKFQPLYKKREQALTTSLPDSDNPNNQLGTPSLPNFWLQCMRNHRSLNDLIEKHDEDVLRYLKNISFKWADPEKQDSYTLQFEFQPNPYFTPLVLQKTYNMACPEGFDEFILSSTSSTHIDWKEGKNVTVQVMQRKQRNSKTKEIRVVNKTKEVSSFFNFFSNHVLPTEEQLHQLSEGEIAEFELTIEADYEVGIIFREKILPHALLWYMGEVSDNDSDFGGSDEGSSSSTDNDDCDDSGSDSESFRD